MNINKKKNQLVYKARNININFKCGPQIEEGWGTPTTTCELRRIRGPSKI